MKQYDIFISYRREGGFSMADSIYQRLINSGYAAFLDLEQLKSGKFNVKLLTVIEQCQDFVLVLPPHALHRCVDEDDGVRQEIEHALKCGKNIIPIMLRGFEWPQPDKLPESLRELPNYNGISASDHNVFVENVERLKKHFLQSKPGFTWRKYKTLLGVGAVALLILLGCIGGWNLKRQTEYKRICNEVSLEMMTEFVKMHHNVAVAENVLEAWNDFERELSKENAEELRTNLRLALEHCRKDLQQPKELLLSEDDRKALRKYGVELEELDVYPMLVQASYDEVMDYFDNVELISQQPLSKILDDNVQFGFKFIQIGLKANYYGLLSIYATMHDGIYEKLQKVIPQLTYMSGIPIHLTQEEYEAMQATTMNELNEIVNKMGGDLRDMKLDVAVMEEKLDRMTEELENRYVDKKLQDIDEKRVAVEARKVELMEMDQKLSDLYNSALQKFALLPSDEQAAMWGKVLRIAKLADISMKSEQSEMERHKQLLEEARRKGLSTEHLSNPYHSITARDKYDNVDKWLVEYQRLNESDENVAKYVESARAYYKAVSKGELDSQIGIILVATQDNQKHPMYEIGDIVVERKGHIIHNVEEYSQLADDPAENVVVVLRLDNGLLKKKALTIPSDCPVLVGLSPLHE